MINIWHVLRLSHLTLSCLSWILLKIIFSLISMTYTRDALALFSFNNTYPHLLQVESWKHSKCKLMCKKIKNKISLSYFKWHRTWHTICLTLFWITLVTIDWAWPAFQQTFSLVGWLCNLVQIQTHMANTHGTMLLGICFVEVFEKITKMFLWSFHSFKFASCSLQMFMFL
jgi:hypothetical protein